MLMIHERKLTETHEAMFRECVKQVPSLKNINLPIVTDREKSIINAIKTEVLSVKLVHCWNCVFKDIQLWCRKHGAPKLDLSVYCDDLYPFFFNHQVKKTMSVNFKRKGKYGILY